MLAHLSVEDQHGIACMGPELAPLTAEIWDILPWQLKVLQMLEQRRQKDWSMLPGTVGVQFPILPQAMPLLEGYTSSSSSSRSVPAAPERRLAPVSDLQLQLVLERVCLNVQLAPMQAGSSFLLLALLLLRADLAQRLQFLQGPQGGLLLAALQQYSCSSPCGSLGLPGLPAGGRHPGWVLSSATGSAGLLETVRGGLPKHLRAADAAGLMLHMLLLEPWDSSSGSSAPGNGSAGNSPSISSSSRPNDANPGLLGPVSYGKYEPQPWLCFMNHEFAVGEWSGCVVCCVCAA
jgi:hypothetical protein